MSQFPSPFAHAKLTYLVILVANFGCEARLADEDLAERRDRMRQGPECYVPPPIPMESDWAEANCTWKGEGFEPGVHYVSPWLTAARGTQAVAADSVTVAWLALYARGADLPTTTLLSTPLGAHGLDTQYMWAHREPSCVDSHGNPKPCWFNGPEEFAKLPAGEVALVQLTRPFGQDVFHAWNPDGHVLIPSGADEVWAEAKVRLTGDARLGIGIDSFLAASGGAEARAGEVATSRYVGGTACPGEWIIISSAHRNGQCGPTVNGVDPTEAPSQPPVTEAPVLTSPGLGASVSSPVQFQASLPATATRLGWLICPGSSIPAGWSGCRNDDGGIATIETPHGAGTLSLELPCGPYTWTARAMGASESAGWGPFATARWFDVRCDAPAPSCTPVAETCNGVDDDCDGQVDEGCTPSASKTLVVELAGVFSVRSADCGWGASQQQPGGPSDAAWPCAGWMRWYPSDGFPEGDACSVDPQSLPTGLRLTFHVPSASARIIMNGFVEGIGTWLCGGSGLAPGVSVNVLSGGAGYTCDSSANGKTPNLNLFLAP